MPKRPVKEAEKLMEQAFTLFESGNSREEIAKALHVSLRTVHRWLQIVKAKPTKPDVQTNVQTDVQTTTIITPSPTVVEDVENPLDSIEDYYSSQHYMALELGDVAVQLLPLLKNALTRFDTTDITPRTFPTLMKSLLDVVNNSNECWIRATGIDMVINKLNQLNEVDDVE